MSALPFVALCALLAQQALPGRLAPVRVQCSGPLAGFELAWPDGSALRASLELAQGEERTLELWLPLPAAGAVGEPTLAVQGTGTLRLEPRPEERAIAAAQAWAQVSAGLRLRPAPPLHDDGAGTGRLPARVLFAAGACLALVFALRARPRAALGVGALGAALALALAGPFTGAPPAVELLEGDGASWMLVRVGHSRLRLGAEFPLRVDTVPVEAPLVLRGTLGAWELAARGARIVARRPLSDVPGGALAPERNDLEDLPRCWLRGSDGLWSHRGPWPRGSSLPPALAGPPPPAGLIAGLPQGRAVLLAERARPERAESDRAWLRLVGFPAAGGDRD